MEGKRVTLSTDRPGHLLSIHPGLEVARFPQVTRFRLVWVIPVKQVSYYYDMGRLSRNNRA